MHSMYVSACDPSIHSFQREWKCTARLGAVQRHSACLSPVKLWFCPRHSKTKQNKEAGCLQPHKLRSSVDVSHCQQFFFFHPDRFWDYVSKQVHTFPPHPSYSPTSTHPHLLSCWLCLGSFQISTRQGALFFLFFFLSFFFKRGVMVQISYDRFCSYASITFLPPAHGRLSPYIYTIVGIQVYSTVSAFLLLCWKIQNSIHLKYFQLVF